MLSHYLAVAVRGFARNPVSTLLSVAVLVLGLGCFMAAYLFVSYLHTYDRDFAKTDRVYVIMQRTEVSSTGMLVPLTPGSALPLAEQLRLDVPELEAVARYAPPDEPAFVTVNGEASYRRIAYAEPAFLDLFDFETLAGDASAALRTPRSAIITEETAQSMFGTRDVVGKTIEITALRPIDVTIAAVVAEIPAASHLSRTTLGSRGFELLLSWDVFEAAAKTVYHDSWGNLPVLTYVLMPKNGKLSVQELNRRLVELSANHIPKEFDWGRFTFEAKPVSDIAARNLQIRFQGFYGVDWPIDVLDALLAVAGAMLAVACLNFVNLATAQSAGRAAAVGARKAIGATAAQIAGQELVRTALLVGVAAVVAIAALVPVGRMVGVFWGDALTVPWSEPRLWLALAVVLPILALAAGFYPALVLARVKPATALRWASSPGGSGALRSLLIGLQFAAASFLLVMVVVFLSQRHALRTALLDRFDDPYVVLDQLYPLEPNPHDSVDPDVLATELDRTPGVEGVTEVSQYPFRLGPDGNRFRRAPIEGAPSVLTTNLYVGHDYFAVMRVSLLAGRVFSRERAEDAMPRNKAEFDARQGAPPRIVLDRHAARALGWADPAEAVGRLVYAQGSAQPFEIIGVVESVPMTLRPSEAAGVTYFLQPRFAKFTIARLAKADVTQALAGLDKTVAALLPGRPAPRRIFFNEAYERSFSGFMMIDRVFTWLAALAITIAGAGLYGMVRLMIVRRTREIGLRKVHGATPAQMLRLLLVDFSKPVLLANVIVWPFAFVAAEHYLAAFTERIPLTPVPFVLALVATLAIAWIMIATHLVRAAHVRPAEALRHE